MHDEKSARGPCAVHDPLIAFAPGGGPGGADDERIECSGFWLRTGQEWRHVGVIPEALNRSRADPGYPLEFIDRSVGTTTLSIGDDSPSQDRTDPWQGLELLGTRPVQVDAPEGGRIDRRQGLDRGFRDGKPLLRDITRGGGGIALCLSDLRARGIWSSDSLEPRLEPVARRPQEEKSHHQPDQPAFALQRCERRNEAAGQ